MLKIIHNNNIINEHKNQHDIFNDITKEDEEEKESNKKDEDLLDHFYEQKTHNVTEHEEKNARLQKKTKNLWNIIYEI